ncbi:hypothetical protein [Bacteroides sp. 519]|uniref:hypothetical protein n=1 Tax=Bacteroides sp. 519 TaxID=2302937 RepID=UPI0013D6235F|nr:hypothetical protein [Bacteroides sp. 519]NDV59154.1 hypothetical protein [Bacteroides sp. 519]
MKKLQINIATVFSVLLLAVALCTSCTDEDYSLTNSSSGDEMTFILNLPKSTVVETRAGFEGREGLKAPVYILVFAEGATGKLEKVIKLKQGTAANTTDGFFIPISGLTDCYKITNKFDLDKTLVALANLDPVLTNVDATLESYKGLKTKTELADILAFTADKRWFIDQFTDANKYNIPMWGELTDYGHGKTNQFNMIRMLAKVNVTFEEKALQDFEITKMYIANYATRGHVIPSQYDAEAMKVTGCDNTNLLQMVSDNETDFLNYSDKIASGSCKHQIYTFETGNWADFPAKEDEENWHDTTDYPDHQKWQKNPCIIIGGKYKGDTETFYRIDFIDNSGKWLGLLRNHEYNVVIKEIKGVGYSSIKEAYARAPMNMDLTLYVTNATGQEEIAVDGPYYLSVDKVDLLMGPNGGSTYKQLITYKTNYGEKPVMTREPTDWLKETTNGIPEGMLGIYVSPYSGSNESREGYATISVGRMSIKIKVTQLPKIKTYVGAFWKHDECEERLIRTALPKKYDCDWEATVLKGQDWIRMDTKRGPDHPYGSTAGDDDRLRDNGYGLSLDPQATNPKNGTTGNSDGYKVLASTTSVRGSTTEDTPDDERYVYFRIGTTGTIGENDNRYGLVLFTYTIKGRGNNYMGQQYMWIRQGEAPDYLQGSASEADAKKPYARFSPYNLTTTGYNTETSGNKRKGRKKLGVQGGRFTEFPSQAGLFSLSMFGLKYIYADYSEDGTDEFVRHVFHPCSEKDDAIWGSGYYSGADRFWSDYVANLGDSRTDRNPKICPPKYHRMRDGSETALNQNGARIGSEMRQSLFGSPRLGVTIIADDTFVFGYYADGFFDRRTLTNAPGKDFAAASAVAVDTENVAYIGTLFYNPNNEHSLFFPAAGYISDRAISGENSVYPGLYNAGREGLYFTTSQAKVSRTSDGKEYMHTWSLIFNRTQIGTTQITRERRAASIRCVRDEEP